MRQCLRPALVAFGPKCGCCPDAGWVGHLRCCCPHVLRSFLVLSCLGLLYIKQKNLGTSSLPPCIIFNFYIHVFLSISFLFSLLFFFLAFSFIFFLRILPRATCSVFRLVYAPRSHLVYVWHRKDKSPYCIYDVYLSSYPAGRLFLG